MKDEGFGVWYVSCGGLGMWGRWFVGVGGGGVRDMRVRGCGLCVRGGLEVRESWMWGGEGELKVKLE